MFENIYTSSEVSISNGKWLHFLTQTNKHTHHADVRLVREICNDLCSVFSREDEDASHCAVPISTSLIKQIVNKNGSEENLEHILAEFYGPKSSAGPPWPYVANDADRYSTLAVACHCICENCSSCAFFFHD